jgi:hypothetical protein
LLQIIRILGQGPTLYFKELINLLDFGVMVFCIIQFAVTGRNDLSAIRSFRFLRVFLLLKQFKALHKLFVVLAETAKDLAYFGVILMLFVFVFTCIGIQLFRGKMEEVPGMDVANPDNPGRPRENYETFWWGVTRYDGGCNCALSCPAARRRDSHARILFAPFFRVPAFSSFLLPCPQRVPGVDD